MTLGRCVINAITLGRAVGSYVLEVVLDAAEWLEGLIDLVVLLAVVAILCMVVEEVFNL